jgi:diguanylate cyclase (GGDEF)-like protein
MSAVAALATCLATWTLTQTVAEYRVAGRVQRAADIDVLLFVGLDKIGVERRVVGDALLAQAPADAAFLARLRDIRRNADDALNGIERTISRDAYPGSGAQLAVMNKARADLAAWRSTVDANLRLPKPERDPNSFLHFMAGMNSLFESITVALDVGDMAAALRDGITVQLIGLSRFVWNARLINASRSVPLMAAINAGKSLGHDQLEAQSRFDGALASVWSSIRAVSRSLSGMADVTAALARGQAAFDDFDAFESAIVAAGRAGADYPVTAIVFGQQLTGTVPALLELRDVALAAARARVAQQRLIALFNLIIAAVVLALTVVTMGIVLMVLQRRIVSPMLALTEVIGRIARLDLDVLVPARNRADEIGRMAVAVETLRLGAIAGEENKAQITRLARHDTLTGLPNRLMLQERLEQAISMAGRGRTSAVLCLDLDRFKAVNDTYGHPTGDLLLQAVADRLSACVRDVDTVSRLGGDEFVVLLVDIDQAAAATTVAQRIVHEMNQPFDLKGIPVSVGISVGIAVTPLDATSGVALLKCADTALYRAKIEDKGSWRFFKPEMDAHLQERMMLERDLREAFRTGALDLVYQPQYELAGERLCGFEALLRWRHPVRGSLPPDLFIPIAEEMGLIIEIGEWVLRRACEEAAHWPSGVTLAVNLSAVQFKSPDLVQTVSRALSDAGFSPYRLELEMTETALVKNNETTLAVLRAFHDIGIQIAMDDFGTGYSSLSYLRGFPFDKIKIDKSFVKDMLHHAGSRAIVKAMVGLAESLGMRTVAEGVETAEQLAELRRDGCHYAQGYHYSRPVDAAGARLLLGMETEVA